MAETGRPSKYSRELAEKICTLIAEGNPLTKICKVEGVPHYATVLRWLSQESDFQEEFREMYARAREDQADTLADEILEIADDSSGDTTTIKNKDGSEREVMDAEYVARSRLRVDSRKWIAAKLKPRKYGDRLGIEGPDGGPLVSNVHIYIPDNGRDDPGNFDDD